MKNYHSDEPTHFDLCQKLMKALKPFLFVKKIKKKETLLEAGEACQHIFFVKSGAVKQYYLSDGKEFIQNFFFFIGLVYLVYASYNHVYTNRQFARHNVWVYYSLPPFAIFSLFVLTDITGWFFIMLTIFAFGHYKNRILRGKHYLILGLIVGVGALFKESALAGGVFAIVSIFFFSGRI